MGRAIVVVALCAFCLAVAGCGEDGQQTAGSRPYAGTHRGPREKPLEAASRLHLSRDDCARLAGEMARLGHRVRGSSRPQVPLSRCLLRGPGVRVSIYLDSARAARQRYKNRMVEQAQFGAPDRRRVPHPVPGVGDPSPADQNASWVPGLSTLFAVRGNRWVTVAYSVRGESEARRLTAAAALARRAFRLSAG